MKSIRVHSHGGRGKEFKSKYSFKKRDTYFNEKPTPLDFDAFIPWFCLELQVPNNIIIKRTYQAEYTKSAAKKLKESHTKSRIHKIRSDSTKSDVRVTETRAAVTYPSSLPPSLTGTNNSIPLTTCYDKRGRLVEIAITGCSFAIHRKVIQALTVCLPFHLNLFKLSITKGGLDNVVIHEIGKLLPYSNITEICLDDSCLPEGNYSLLLQQSKLKYLSLKRCGIHDEECQNIADALNLKGTAAKTLLLLNLASNKITDGGARALGETLKNNRHLLYLNLSGNYISDNGAAVIFYHLKEFPLSQYDIIDKRRRRLNYLKTRRTIYEKCLDEAKLARTDNNKEASSLSSDPLIPIMSVHQHAWIKKIKENTPSFADEELSVEEVAEKMTTEKMGEFEEPFKEENIKRSDNLLYSEGNLTLCFLDLAYNNLSLISIRKISDVLQYQSEANKTNQNTGLLRVGIDGNNFPSRCYEVDKIVAYLQKAVLKHNHYMAVLSRTPSSTLSERRIK